MNQRVSLGIVAAALLIGGATFWYLQNKKTTDSPSVEEPASLGAQIFERTENPTKDQFPEANPFAVDTNPFDSNTNPYKDEYKNPFD